MYSFTTIFNEFKFHGLFILPILALPANYRATERGLLKTGNVSSVWRNCSISIVIWTEKHDLLGCTISIIPSLSNYTQKSSFNSV
jgi:hypothetical protein